MQNPNFEFFSMGIKIMAGRGGKRPGAGRKKGQTDKKRKKLQEILTLKDTEKCVNRLRELIDNDDPRISIEACKYILDQTHGRPKQAVDVDQTNKLVVVLEDITNASEEVN